MIFSVLLVCEDSIISFKSVDGAYISIPQFFKYFLDIRISFYVFSLADYKILSFIMFIEINKKILQKRV